MDLVAELNSENTKRKKFQVFKNVSFDSTAIAVISRNAYFDCNWIRTQNHLVLKRTLKYKNTKYKAVFTVLKFFYLVILTFKESLILEIGTGTLPWVWELFLNLAMYQEIGVKPHYCIINIRLQGYFEWSILSCS